MQIRSLSLLLVLLSIKRVIYHLAVSLQESIMNDIYKSWQHI